MNNRSKINFNSIKVRLKQVSPDKKSSEEAFQFHKGTIKTFACRDIAFAITISIP